MFFAYTNRRNQVYVEAQTVRFFSPLARKKKKQQQQQADRSVGKVYSLFTYLFWLLNARYFLFRNDALLTSAVYGDAGAVHYTRDHLSKTQAQRHGP